MQDTSHLIRNLLLVALISSGGPIAGCAIDEDDDDRRRSVFHEDRLDEDRVEDEDADD